MDTLLHDGRPAADPFPPDWQYDPLTGIGRVLARIKITMMEAMDAELAAFDITSAQYVVMVNLGSGQADSTASLCKGVSYDPGAMTRMLDRLEKKGLVTRERCPDDRRKVKLALTPAGKALYPDIVAAAGRVVRGLLRGFSAGEVTELEQLLARMLANGAAAARPAYEAN